jgi:HlyD family secretion protein
MKRTWKTPMRIGIAAAGLLAMSALAAWVFFHAKTVDVIEVRPASLKDEIHGPGTLAARIPVTVSTRITGVIAALNADDGDTVRRDQLLAMLDDRDVAAKASAAREAHAAAQQNIAVAEALIAKAKADVALARSNHRRDAALVQQGFISEAAMDASNAALESAESAEQGAIATLAARKREAANAERELEYAKTLVSFTRITAPMDGVLIQRNAEVGDTVVPGARIFRMVDPRTLWVAVRVDETVAGRVSVGQPARIRLRTGGEVPGKVARVTSRSDAETRELEVDVAFDELPKRFAIDQEAEVSILAGTITGLAVPVSALLKEKGVQGVLVVRDGRAQFQSVQTGLTDDAQVLVRQGLQAGDFVVRKPQQVRSGSKVRGQAAGG